MFRSHKRSRLTIQHATRQHRVNVLAKLCLRFKRLHDLKTLYLRRRLPHKIIKANQLDVEEIRLLRIQPGNALSTVSCTFVYSSLSDASKYAALSYTWDTAAPTIPILLDGKIALVTENLNLALVHLRTRGVSLLWVDALCINQTDKTERASQVSQMDRVYKGATTVWIWLGDSDHSSHLAFKALYDLAQRLEWDDSIPRSFFEKDMDQHPEKWRAISEILYRPWFRPVWIIQEVLCARHALVICGNEVMTLVLFLRVMQSLWKAEMLKSALAFHTNRLELVDGAMKVALRQIGFFVETTFPILNFPLSRFKMNLLNLMAETRWAEATNPLDKVYGVFSLANDARSLGYQYFGEGENTSWCLFKVDYNLSAEQLSLEITKAIIYTSGSLEILRFARFMPDDTSNLPSWVTNWTKSTPHNVHNYLPLETTGRGHDTTWRTQARSKAASDNTRSQHAIYREITDRCKAWFQLGGQNTLTVKGLHFDTILKLTSTTLPEDHNISLPIRTRKVETWYPR